MRPIKNPNRIIPFQVILAGHGALSILELQSKKNGIGQEFNPEFEKRSLLCIIRGIAINSNSLRGSAREIEKGE